MKIIHFADVHYCREYKDMALASLRVLLETGKRERIDLWALPGDLFERGIQNSDRDGFGELLDIIRQMLDLAPMVCVQGTMTHDVVGCYDVLTRISALHQFILLQPGKTYRLTTGEDHDENPITFVHDEDTGNDSGDLLILGMPEPSKAWLLAGENGIGKDEANAKIKQGLRDILLGYGAVRKNNPSIPCLMLYHGLVDGASTSTGQALTGDIGISRDDLSLAGADYYALGHIHKAQQIPGLPAYYAGSAYPTDWGELEQKQFNVVNIVGDGDPDWKSFEWALQIQRLSFPHAPRKKIDATCSDPVTIEKVDGFQVWWCVRDFQTIKDHVGILNVSDLIDAGALPGSRVDFTPIPTETVRAIEIQGVKSLPEKVEVWAKNSGLEVRESVLEKARQLETEAKKAGYLPQPHAWRLRKVHVRGLKGIKRGMGIDDFEIDFDHYEQGLIALVAENGTGKTSLMTNCHFFTSVLLSGGKLQDYFCLRDSQRDVYATDEVTGIDYYGQMLIDGKNKSGKAEYYLFKGSIAQNQWKPISSGKKEDYEAKVAELFGLESIYLRSAFIPAEPTPQSPDLGYIAQGEKKRIFYELSGIGFYSAYVKSITSRVKEIRMQLDADEATITANQGLLEKLSDLEQEKTELEKSIKSAQKELTAHELTGRNLKITLDHFAAIVKANGETQAKIDTLMRVKGTAYSELANQDRKLQTAKSFSLPVGIESVTELEEQIQYHAELAQKKNELESQKNEVDRHNLEMKKIENEVAQLREKKQFLIDQVGDFDRMLAKKITCPKCGEQFALNREQIETQKRQVSEKIFDVDKEIEEKRHAIQYVNWNVAPLEAVKKELYGIDINQLMKIAGQAKTVEQDRVNAENQIKKLHAKIDSLTSEIEELTIILDSEADRLYSETSYKYETERRKWSDKNAEISGLQGRISVLAKEIEEKKVKVVEIDNLKTKVEKNKSELCDWDFLAEACGIDGIPALELDAVAPEISATANELLAESYGQRFQVEFRTTKIAGTGSKKKQVEDFSIWIKDASDGWEQEYSTLSGGEKTWIKKAISDAFEITRARNTGVRFLTVFQDELDGKLDPEHKRIFFQQLASTHQRTGRHHTILVTHSEAAQEQIVQKIEMKKAVPI